MRDALASARGGEPSRKVRRSGSYHGVDATGGGRNGARALHVYEFLRLRSPGARGNAKIRALRSSESSAISASVRGSQHIGQSRPRAGKPPPPTLRPPVAQASGAGGSAGAAAVGPTGPRARARVLSGARVPLPALACARSASSARVCWVRAEGSRSNARMCSFSSARSPSTARASSISATCSRSSERAWTVSFARSPSSARACARLAVRAPRRASRGAHARASVGDRDRVLPTDRIAAAFQVVARAHGAVRACPSARKDLRPVRASVRRNDCTAAPSG